MAFVPLNTNNSNLANYNSVNNAIRDLTNKTNKLNIQNVFNPYKFHAQRSGAYTMVATTWTVFPFNTEVYDVNGNYDTGTYRYTAPVDGYYIFTARVNSELSYTRMLIALYKNGVAFARGTDFSTGTASQYVQPTVAAMINLAKGDYVDCRYYVNAAQAWTAGTETNYFMGHLLSV